MIGEPLSFTDGAVRYTVALGKAPHTPGTGVRFTSATAARSFFERVAANPANRQAFAFLVQALFVGGVQVSMGRLLGTLAAKAVTGDLHVRREPPAGPPAPPPRATAPAAPSRESWRPTSASLSLDEITRIVRENNNSGLSDDLIICLAYKESTFNATVKNVGSTATGLMQITKAAVTDVNTNYKALGANFSHADMTDAVKNVQCGTWYLKLRVKWKKGDVSAGLAGYGTGDAYAASILKCEQCRTAKTDSIECLKSTHG
jgi:soluble lytic murein transglycosylase-like protein